MIGGTDWLQMIIRHNADPLILPKNMEEGKVYPVT